VKDLVEIYGKDSVENLASPEIKVIYPYAQIFTNMKESIVISKVIQ
jgi:hypothetical protein